MKPRPSFGKLHPPEVHHVTASSSPSPSGAVSELHGHVRSLAETLSTSPTQDQDVSLAILRLQCTDLGNIRKVLVEEPATSPSGVIGHNSSKDAFRRFDGFKILLRLLHGLKGFCSEHQRSRDEKTAFFDLLKLVFEVLSAAIVGHTPNRRYFNRRLDRGGWFLLAQALESTGIAEADNDQDELEVLFGLLFDLVTGHDGFKKVFRGIDKANADKADNTSTTSLGQLTEFINEKFDKNTSLQIPEAINVIIHLWRIYIEACSNESALMLAIPLALRRIQMASIRNQVLLHNISVLPTLLDMYRSSDSEEIQESLKPILDNLLKYGVPNLIDAYDLFRYATKSDESADLVLKGMQSNPQFIHFDLSRCGYCSIEISSLGQPFPPSPSTGYSISLWARFDQFDTQFKTVLFGAQDPSLTCNMLLYIDPSSKHLALQTATSNGNSADGFRPTVFRSTRFTIDRWYHIVITHKKIRTGPMNTGSAYRVALFVDGSLVETVKCPYPSTPPPMQTQSNIPGFLPSSNSSTQLREQGQPPHFSRSSSAESFASLSLSGIQQSISAAASGALSNVSGADPAPVSAFLGSPEGMSSGSKSSGFPNTKWSLATLHVIRDVLSEDIVRIIHGLGPRYAGNFQDVLGSFQTYGSAAAIHVVNEEQMTIRDGKSDGQNSQHPDRTELARALSRPGNLLLPESKIAVGIWAQGVINTDTWEFADGDAPITSTNSEGVLIRNLGREAAKTLHRLLLKDGNSPIDSRSGLILKHTGVVLNAGIPDYNLALLSSSSSGQPAGYALLTGSSPVFSPTCTSLADAAWRIAGCAPPLLKILSRASTKEEVLRAVAIIFDALGVSWRNSEAVERENGYVVLAGVMREKLGFGSMFGDEFTSNTSSDATNGSSFIAIPLHEREELALELLRMSLKFVGYSERDPESSVLTNSMAYRGLLVEFDTWRKAPMATQKLYYAQFVRFAGSGKAGRFGRFNARRIVRMRLIKRFIDALKGETFTEDVFPDFLEAFNAVFKCTVSVDTLRAVPLFITYALQEHRAFPTYNSNTNFRPISAVSNGKGRPSTPSPFGNLLSTEGAFKVIPRFEIGVRILEDFADILCGPEQSGDEELIRKFATSVTNKWLLHLLAEKDSRIIVLSTKILARLLVVHGSSYVRNFADKTGGFVVLAKRLRSWWSIPALWMNLFAILFNVDPAKIDYDIHSSEFNQFTLAEAFAPAKGVVACREVLRVMMRMLETGLRCVVHDTGEDDDKPVESKTPEKSNTTTRPRSGSTLKVDAVVHPASAYDETNNVEVIHAVARFLADCHLRYPSFRDFATNSSLVQELLFTVYPVVVTADPVSAETELLGSGSTTKNSGLGLNFEGQDVVLGPNPSEGSSKQSIIRTTPVAAPTPPPQRPGGTRHHRAASFRRPSSFILVTSSESPTVENKTTPPPKPTAKFHSIVAPSGSASLTLKVGSNIVQNLLGIVTAVSLDQVLYRKDFNGFSLSVKIPPGFQEHQAFFESHIHTLIMSELSNTIRMQEKIVFGDARVITNLHRYFLHVIEAVFEGWYMNDGAEKLLDFLGQTLELLQRPEVAKLKTVRLCTQQVAMMKNTFQRVALFILAELMEDPPKDPSLTVTFLEKLNYWQGVLLSPLHDETRFLRLLFYHLYIRIVGGNPKVRAAVIQFWRVVLMHKDTEAAVIMRDAVPSGQRYLANGFLKLVELDDEPFLVWVDHNRTELDGAFLSSNGLAKYWEDYVNDENKRIEDTSTIRTARRRDQLKRWAKEEVIIEDIWRRHESQTNHWRNNVFASERIRHQKAIQDQQDTLIMAAATVDKFDRILEEPCGLFESLEKMKKRKWQLDETEGQNRMRLRIVPDRKTIEDDYRPKRYDQSQSKKSERQDSKLEKERQIALRETASSSVSASPVIGQSEGFGSRKRADSRSSQSGLDEYEIVEDPHRTEDGEFEDKNRKVTRTLQPKDVILHVCNVSRIEGLEAIEGLLIIGKDCMYLIDHYFQRSDGEVVGVWQAPSEERDRYLRMISGRETSVQKPKPGDRTRRHWRWADVLLISKRRFLLRDVALEIFFTDGRGYLLTSATPDGRNELFSRLVTKSPLVNNAPSSLPPEELLRVEALRSPEDQPQSLGSKFASVFNAGASNPATKKWMRGELSNFAYLMQVNTMAGRTFNDLTQYPVFPWVLADYESTELDLTDPLAFRDFSKPMGAQDPARAASFRRRYEEVQSMSSDPPHHYGTHYSSAMTVCQYLMRLQPFVKSYLLLQGGNFDHPDRLFYSIAEAWMSASKRNMSDVRELTPEFFYLPEFLINLNGYNFGSRQAGGESIDAVELPPWAHGDPHIFIQKHREALESPFVTANLHKWIDLVFGAKQTGEAAVDSVNVFHFLSYHGAVDLESIVDQQEQLAAIGIIHNFGQTPRQVFTRPHPQRDSMAATKFSKENDLNTVLNELSRGPSAVIDIRERVNGLVWSARAEKVLATGPYAIAVPPGCEGVMKFGFVDGSMRFFTAPTPGFGESASKGKQVMHMEHIHAGGGISTAIFVDGKTLVTAGRDGVVILFNVGTSQQLQITTGNTGGAGVVSKGAVESVSQRDALFGHRYPVTLLAASKALATLLSADSSGRVLMWDVNRGEFVREIAPGCPPSTLFAEGRHQVGDECVRAMKICGATGEIVLCAGRRVKIFSLNGQLLADSVVANGEEEGVTACAWYEGSGRGEWVDKILLLTGHRNGVVKIWTKTINENSSKQQKSTSEKVVESKSTSFTLTLLRKLTPPGPHLYGQQQHVHAPPMLQEASKPAAVTSILARSRCVYVGDELGRVFEWRAE